MVRALVIRAAGTNCDHEMARGFELVGAAASIVHLESLVKDPARLLGYDIIGFPGGFSYGDDIASGRLFAVRLRERLWPVLRQAAAEGRMMIGICNGFQVMVQAGLLPGPVSDGASDKGSDAAGGSGLNEGENNGGEEGDEREGRGWLRERALAQEAALLNNSCGRYVDRWVRVRFEPNSVCVWTRGVEERFASKPDLLMLPVGHGEGRFHAAPAVLARLESRGQIAVRYLDNPNGSANDIAGVCDESGRVFALMPHPDRYLSIHRHPFWTRLSGPLPGETPGLAIFRNAVEAAASSGGMGAECGQGGGSTRVESCNGRPGTCVEAPSVRAAVERASIR